MDYILLAISSNYAQSSLVGASSDFYRGKDCVSAGAPVGSPVIHMASDLYGIAASKLSIHCNDTKGICYLGKTMDG